MTPRSSSEYADVAMMFRRLQSLDPESAAFHRQRDEIIARTLPLANHIARRFRNRGEPLDDLVQAARVGLVNAVNRFDIDNGADFLGFAVPTMMGEVRRHFRDYSWAVKVPRRLKDLQAQKNRSRSELTQQIGRAPTAAELAAHMGVDRQTIIDLEIASSNYSTLSTDQSMGSDDDRPSIGEGLGSDDPGLDKVVDVETVRPLIAALPQRLRTVLTLRFFEEMTQSQIADQIGCSQMHVSRLLAQALNVLRAQSEGDVKSATSLAATA
ncbi:SigB/SigF/SigG family RNA polymerase sigma factor [Mycobacterium deserti]|uniref:SigB/SigF/SigG family RNA polymerase sigma factor n=1 Tax=Mycobacterium deserti TaxID=2978347 RepID=A0ABT2MFQ6_9MYCO|nr:SigB/SigF/SigG family RNA polymerase sigma factor [Mycobacterium deserti]MCT7661114.1 SigB/SigF/SigG family RNA polymerase sigma factor [Mycobacterium deserti]